MRAVSFFHHLDDDEGGLTAKAGKRILKKASDLGVRIRILDIPRVIAANRRRAPEFIKNAFRDIGVVVCTVRLELDAQSVRVGVIADTLDG